VMQYPPDSEIEIILPDKEIISFEDYRTYIDSALEMIRSFSIKHGWESYTKDAFINKLMVYDDKKEFDQQLLKLVEADPGIELPETYCAALENKILVIVTPEIYSRVFPEGIEENSYVKLITHEIAHRLHIRIIEGLEDHMGPIWFYEGFAIYVADQFSNSELQLSRDQIIEIMNYPGRGNYQNYGHIFRLFAEKMPLLELIMMAKEEHFNERLIPLVGE